MNTRAETLGADLRHLADETEHLLKSAANSGDEQVAALRSRLEGQLKHLRTQIGDAEAAAMRQARQAVRATDETVRAHPYSALGIAAAAGLLIGFLAAKR
jgi:ElaB/YqjD/DUF883 family membrane-anchored ribosome-binding protein